MKYKRKLLLALAFVGFFGWGSGAQSAIQDFDPLPTPNCGLGPTNNCIQFGDFAVYSLALISMQATFAANGTIDTNGPQGSDPFYVKSDPGELGNTGYIVYGTGTNNQNTTKNGDDTLIDRAQSTPESGGGSTFSVGTATETLPTFPGDITATWDGTLSAIRAELGATGDQFVSYFNLNETGNNDLAGIDLLAWAHVSLVDTICTSGDGDDCLATKDYYLEGGNLLLGLPFVPGTQTAPDPSNPFDPNWVYVHGTICVNGSLGFVHFGPCTAAEKGSGFHDVNQNLGANTAAFAIFNQELSDLILDPFSGYEILRVEYRFAFIVNGFEQIFSALGLVCPPNEPTCVPTIPEPGSLALAGLGLVLLAGMVGWRRQRRMTA